MQNVYVPRPLTHDFVCAIIGSLGGIAKEAIIDKLENDCFDAKRVISTSKGEADIDCRPSDALGVAVRSGIPIFANDKVLNKAGVLDPETGQPIEHPTEVKEVSKEKIGTDTSRLEIFSESAQQVLNEAESDAKRFNHNYVGTGHLLLALLKQQNIAVEVLKNLNIEPANTLTEMEKALVLEPGSEQDDVGLTSAVKKTIQLALEEARCLGSKKVNPEHILIGLVRQGNSMASSLLANLRINPERIYVELIRLYTRPWPEQQTPSN
jgi:bifunctional DNase/RNase